MNRTEYIELLKTKIIDEKLNGKRFDVIRELQKELDMVLESKEKSDFFNDTSLKDIEKADKNDTLNQLEKYLLGLRNISRTHKDKLVEERLPKDGNVRFINLQERLTLEELEGINAEIEFIEKQINIFKDGNR
jgi:hypothetical protein